MSMSTASLPTAIPEREGDILSSHENALEFLGELTNIGAGNAATAMSTFLDAAFGMKPPTVHELTIEEATALLGDSDAESTVALLNVAGEMAGLMALFVADPEPFAEAASAPPEMALPLIAELGNIVASRFLAAVGTLTGLNGTAEPPAVATAGRLTILETVLAMSAQTEPFVLLGAQMTTPYGDVDLIFTPKTGTVERLKALAG